LDLLDDLLHVVFVQPGLAAEVIEGTPQRTPEIIEYHLSVLDARIAKVLFVRRRDGDSSDPVSDALFVHATDIQTYVNTRIERY